MENILIEFISQCGNELIHNKLEECFLLHLITLHDYQQIDKKIFENIISQFFNKFKIN
jgi:hypothetical protein